MKKLFLFSALFLALVACSDDDDKPTSADADGTEETTTGGWQDATTEDSDSSIVTDKNGNITYQLLVYSFADSDGDGMGDFQGIIDHLDYLDDLGVSAIWLSPIHPAMSYHGYDVTDYTAINPDYGTEADFDRLITAAHERNIKIYLDYVMNHTGSDHEWFQSAKNLKDDSPYRNYYIFSSDPASDIKAGNIPMIETTGYSSGEWFTTVSTDIEGYFTFYLDWTNSSAPTITVTEATAADVNEPASGYTDSDPRYLYYGTDQKTQFINNGNGTYSLTTYISTNWGFLIRTSLDTWDNGTKWGASSSTSKLTLGEAYTLDTSTAADILFTGQDLEYYHSCFGTSSFADLNYGDVNDVENNETFIAMCDAAKGWLDKGVDGFRLDAVKHIYHNATSSENPTFLAAFYDEMNEYYKSVGGGDDIYVVGEVLSEYNEVAPYYAGLPSLFDFSFWYRLEWAINNSQGYYFAQNIIEYREAYASYRTDYKDAIKLSNHDEQRSASSFSGSTDKEKLACAVLLTSPGYPYIYYGEELGLTGTQSNGDEYVRQPMVWGNSYDTKYTDKISTPGVACVDDQLSDESSLLSTYLKFTKLRNAHPALYEGEMSEHTLYNHTITNANSQRVCAYYMTSATEKMLVVHNFGDELQITVSDNYTEIAATSGSVQQNGDDATKIKLGKYATAVFVLE